MKSMNRTLLFAKKSLFFLLSAGLCALLFVTGRTGMAQEAAIPQGPLSAPSGLISKGVFTRPSAATARDQRVSFSDVRGGVQIQKKAKGEWLSVQKGDAVHSGDAIRVPEDSRAEISFDKKAAVFLVPNTQLRVDQSTKTGSTRTTKLYLQSGRLKAAVRTLGEGSLFEVTSPTAVSAVRGTLLYLNASQLGNNPANAIGELYVDRGNVDFWAVMDRNKHLLVDRYGISSVDGEGNMTPLRHLTPDEREAFIEAFEELYRNAGNPQFALETLLTPPPDALSGPNRNGEFLNDRRSDLGPTNQTNNNVPPIGEFDDVAPQIAELLAQTRQLEESGDESISRQEEVKESSTLLGGPEILLADLNHDGTVSLEDLNLVRNFFGTTNPAGDVNRDGIVNIDDLNEVRNNMGLSTGGDPHPTHSWQYEDVFLGDIGLAGDNGIVSDDRLAQLRGMDQLIEAARLYLEGIGGNADNLFDLLAIALQGVPNDFLLPPALEEFLQAQGFFDLIAGNEAAMVARFEELQRLRAVERDAMLGALNEILQDQSFRREQAQVERAFDFQTGKVGIDIHGNRFRTDSYIFQPDTHTIEYVGLTLRTAGKHAGISSLVWQTRFKNAVEGDFRDLPWNDFLTIVTNSQLNELAGEYSIPEGAENSSQYIVHFSSGSEDLSNHPVSFWARFANPNNDRVIYEEFFTDPLWMSLGTSTEDGYWIQAFDRGALEVYLGGSGVPVISTGSGFIKLPQAGGSNGLPLDLNDFTPENQPATWIIAVSRNDVPFEESAHLLLGMFVPFDNDGNVFEAPGFMVRGLRDLVSPDQNVNSGKYNLEVIWQFIALGQNGAENTEVFEIDLVITPEIFQPVFMMDDYSEHEE